MPRSSNKPKRQTRKPKRVDKGKRYRCARCLKRSPKRIKTPPTTMNPYLCANCRGQGE